MRLVEQWKRVERGLDPRWSDLDFSLWVEGNEARKRAAALLGPANPLVSRYTIRFHVTRSGHGIGPEAARRLLGRIDAERIRGKLTLDSTSEAEVPHEIARPSLATEWQTAREALPSDWSDLMVELELDSSGDVDRAAVFCAPLNPMRGTDRPNFRFRCASERGYGASPGMVGRCLARLDEAEIGGRVRIARVLSDVHPVGTQGATFLVGRRPA